MTFELISEELHNLLVPYTPLLTEEILEAVEGQLRDGLLMAPYLIISGEGIEAVELAGWDRLAALSDLIRSAGGALLVAGLSEQLKEEFQLRDFECTDDLQEAFDEVDARVLDDDLDRA